jgi:hypothetical protein
MQTVEVTHVAPWPEDLLARKSAVLLLKTPVPSAGDLAINCSGDGRLARDAGSDVNTSVPELPRRRCWPCT